MAKPKQPRKEVVSFRLEPKIKYLVDIAARIQRRSPTNYIEYTLENSLRDLEIEKGKSLLQAADFLWSTDESVRTLHLAEKYPELLVFEEQKITDLMKKFNIFFQNEAFTPKAYEFYNIIKPYIDGNLEGLSYAYLIEDFYNVLNSQDDNYRAKYKIQGFIRHMINNEENSSPYELLAWNILRTVGVWFGAMKDGIDSSTKDIFDDIENYEFENMTEWWLDLLLAAPFPWLWAGHWAISKNNVSNEFKKVFPNFEYEKYDQPF